MGVMGDTFEEFKKASPTEKVVIIGGSIAVLGIALYLHNKGALGGSQGATGTGGPSTPQSGYPTIPQGQTPVLPYGTNPLYDPNGNLIGFQNSAPPKTPSPTPIPTPTPTPKPGVCPPGVFCTSYGPPKIGVQTTPTQGPIYAGPTGVLHYTVQPGDTLRSISHTYIPGGTWNSIYAIPQNQQTFGPLSPQKAATYAPKPGTVITLPGNAAIPKQGGGPYGTRVLGQRGRRIAPTSEGHSYTAKVYAHRNARMV